MGEVTITFMGICTHFEGGSPSWLPVAHRVVLVNASNLSQPLANQPIPPHYATLTTPDQVVPMAGQTLTVQDAVGPLTLNMWDLVPNLTELMQDFGGLGPPSMSVVIGQNPALAGYCDFNSGAFVAMQSSPEGEVMTAVTVQTTSPDVTLVLTPFPTTLSAVAPAPTQITLPSPANVTVQNISTDQEFNSEFHFYLNYLTAATFPADPQLPQQQLSTNVGGPGCSNTNYP